MKIIDKYIYRTFPNNRYTIGKISYKIGHIYYYTVLESNNFGTLVGDVFIIYSASKNDLLICSLEEINKIRTFQ